MKLLLSKLDRIEEYVLVITMPLMLLFIFMATIFRYFELGSLTWAEEAARYLMIWLAFAGISLGFKKNIHLGLSFFVGRFPENTQKIFHFIRTILIVVFGGLLSYNTYLIIGNQLRNPQISPALGMPMWQIYSAVLFGSIMIIIRTLQMTFIKVTETDKGGV